MKAKVVERTVLKCSECEKEVRRCDFCLCYFEIGEPIYCIEDVEYPHVCEKCSEGVQ